MLGSNGTLAIYEVHVPTKISKLKVFLAKRNDTTPRSRESADGRVEFLCRFRAYEYICLLPGLRLLATTTLKRLDNLQVIHRIVSRVTIMYDAVLREL